MCSGHIVGVCLVLLCAAVAASAPGAIACAEDGMCEAPPEQRPESPPPAACVPYIMHDRAAVYEAYRDAVKRRTHAEDEARRLQLELAACTTGRDQTV